jgi:hypothetical protein
VVLALGFRFDVDAVIIGGTAHRPGCELLTEPLPRHAQAIPAGGVYRALCCPRQCPRCRPAFETLLSYQLERPLGEVIR